MSETTATTSVNPYRLYRLPAWDGQRSCHFREMMHYGEWPTGFLTCVKQDDDHGLHAECGIGTVEEIRDGQ